MGCGLDDDVRVSETFNFSNENKDKVSIKIQRQKWAFQKKESNQFYIPKKKKFHEISFLFVKKKETKKYDLTCQIFLGCFLQV